MSNSMPPQVAAEAEGWRLHQPAQQCGGLWDKAASKKKAQHGEKKRKKPKKPPPKNPKKSTSFLQCSYLDPRSLSQSKSWGWEEELQTIPKAAHDWKSQAKKMLLKLITGGLAKVFNPSNGKKETPEKTICTASILLLVVLLFPLFSILVPAGRDKEVGYGGFTW